MTAVLQTSPYLALILLGFLPNEVWRWLGLWISRGIDEGSETLLWVRAIATALLAGVIGRIIFWPPAALDAVPLTIRLVAVAAGFLAFLLIRRSVLVGVLTGEAVLGVGAFLSGRF